MNQATPSSGRTFTYTPMRKKPTEGADRPPVTNTGAGPPRTGPSYPPLRSNPNPPAGPTTPRITTTGAPTPRTFPPPKIRKSNFQYGSPSRPPASKPPAPTFSKTSHLPPKPLAPLRQIKSEAPVPPRVVAPIAPAQPIPAPAPVAPSKNPIEPPKRTKSFIDEDFADSELESLLAQIEARSSQQEKAPPASPAPVEVRPEIPITPNEDIKPSHVDIAPPANTVPVTPNPAWSDRLAQLEQENAKLKSQMGEQNGEIIYLREQKKKYEAKEIETSKSLSHARQHLSDQAQKEIEALQSEISRCKSHIQFKEEEARDATHKYEAMIKSYEEKKLAITQLQQQVTRLRTDLASPRDSPASIEHSSPRDGVPTPSSEASSWLILPATSSHEDNGRAARKMGPYICALMEILGQKRRAQGQQRFKALGSESTPSVSTRMVPGRTESLSDIETPLESYSNQLQFVYTQILTGISPCHSIFPILGKLCHTRDPVVIERILQVTLIAVENCSECRSELLQADEAQASVIPSSCDESQREVSQEEKKDDAPQPHGAFPGRANIVTSLLGKRARGPMDPLPSSKIAKSGGRRDVSRSPPFFDQLRRSLNDFCRPHRTLLKLLLRVFTLLAYHCPIDHLQCFEVLLVRPTTVSTNLIQHCLSDNMELQLLAMELLVPLLRHSTLLELIKQDKDNKSILDRVVQLLSVRYVYQESLVRQIRRRSVHILSMVFSLHLDGRPSLCFDDVETVITKNTALEFLHRLIRLLNSEIEIITQSQAPAVPESLCLIRESVQLLSMTCYIYEEAFYSVPHLFVSVMNHLKSGKVHPSLSDLTVKAQMLLRQCSPVSEA